MTLSLVRMDIDMYKSIFNPAIARKLLKLGNPIYDIKADKKNKDKTIFIFEKTKKLDNDINSLHC